jgi:hypothetical protein
MKVILLIIRWIYGISILFGGFAILTEGQILLGVISILLGLFITPITLNLFTQKTGIQIPKEVKIIVAGLGFFVFVFYLALEQGEKREAKMALQKEEDAKTDLLVDKAIAFVDQNKIDSASHYIELAKNKYHSKNENKAVEFERVIKMASSIKYVEDVLAGMSEDEYKLLKRGKLDKVYINNVQLNKNFIAMLVKNKGSRKEIKARKERELKAARKSINAEKVKKQFSPYDGHHRNLERFIKDNMHDPDSYDHDDTRYTVYDDYIIVITSYRGKNAFGGVVKNYTKAKISFDGEILQILD